MTRPDEELYFTHHMKWETLQNFDPHIRMLPCTGSAPPQLALLRTAEKLGRPRVHRPSTSRDECVLEGKGVGTETCARCSQDIEYDMGVRMLMIKRTLTLDALGSLIVDAVLARIRTLGRLGGVLVNTRIDELDVDERPSLRTAVKAATKQLCGK